MDNNTCKKILIIKSSSIQHIQFVIDKVMKQFNVQSVDMLSHNHAINSIKEIIPLDKVFSYLYAGDFSFYGILDKRFAPLRNYRYDAIVIPCSNISGSGYENIIAMSLFLRFRSIYLCNISGDLIRLKRKDIMARLILSYVSYPPAILFSFLISSVSVLYLLLLNGYNIFINNTSNDRQQTRQRTKRQGRDVEGKVETFIPSHAHIEPTILCNLDCMSCISPIISHKTTSPHLSLISLKAIIRDAPFIRDISLLGRGEPLLNHEILDIVEFLHAEGIAIRLATNGMLIDRIDIARLLACLEQIIISYDSTDQNNFESLRRGASLAKVTENIEQLVKIRFQNRFKTKILLNTVVSNKNYNYLSDIPVAAKRLNVDGIKFTMAVQYIPTNARNTNNDYKTKYNMIDELQIKDKGIEDSMLLSLKCLCNIYGLESYFSDTKKKAIDCWWPNRGVNITYDGYVTPCCLRMDPAIINFGNVFTTSLRTIWEGERYKEFKDRFKDGGYPSICHNCPM